MAEPDTPNPRSLPNRAAEAARRITGADWFKPFRSAGVLLIGRTANGVLSLAYIAVAARALGTTDFGALVLIHGVVLGINQLVAFRSWQAVVHYGTPAVHHDDTAGLHRLLKFSLLLDFLSAVTGLAIVLTVIEPAATLFGINMDRSDLLRLYGCSLVFLAFGSTPRGVLRLFDRFDLLAIHSTVMPVIRLLGASLAFAAGYGLPAFLIVWFAATVCDRVTLLLMGGWELHRQGRTHDFDGSFDRVLRPTPGIWHFAFSTNVNSSLNLAQTHLGTLMVGWLLGPAAAGLYRVAKQFSDVLDVPLRRLLIPAIFPELVRLRITGERSVRQTMVYRTAILAGTASLAVFAAFVLFGEGMIGLIVGPEFTAAYGTMLCLAGAGVIGAWSFSLEPFLISGGQVHYTVGIRIIGTGGYLLALYFLLQAFGLIGAGAAMIVYAGMIAGLLVLAYVFKRYHTM